jgi:predicted CXXCH cytochrome family protein
MPGLPLEDTHHPALLTQPTYHADGQQLDEDYTWGSFRQSKMYQKGVTCMDCHEPHALKLRAEGKALCARCHNPDEFDDPKHHFHASGSSGAQCMNCHAPEQNYMVIDGRHDHSFRLPRPDLSQTLNTPNACNQCHQDQKSTWASEAMDRWYGVAWRQRPHYGQVLQAGVTQGIKALPSLLALAQDKTVPAVVRATASTIAQPLMRADFLSAVEVLLQDSDPSVRIAGLGLLESFEISVRIQNAARLLSDPVRGVRIEAGRLLADAPIQQIPADKQTAWQNALKEYRNVLQHESDWPATHINMGNLALRQGDIDSAIAAYQKVLAMDARFVAAYINLADIYRQQGKEAEGEALLRKGLNLLPDAADLHHALGLLMVRKHEVDVALKEFETAVKQAPDNARYAFVYAVALHSAGKTKDALKVLQTAERHWPYDLEILSMLINLQRESGQIDSALVYAKRVAEVLPNDEGIRQLLKELQLQQ